MSAPVLQSAASSGLYLFLHACNGRISPLLFFTSSLCFPLLLACLECQEFSLQAPCSALLPTSPKRTHKQIRSLPIASPSEARQRVLHVIDELVITASRVKRFDRLSAMIKIQSQFLLQKRKARRWDLCCARSRSGLETVKATDTVCFRARQTPEFSLQSPRVS